MALFSKLFLLLTLPVFLKPGSESTVPKPLHPFYISFTEVAHNAAEKSIEVSCKFFADDFEQTLETAYKKTLDIAAEKDKPSFDRFIPDYIGKRLLLSVDGKPVTLKYVGYEKESESVHCYFEVTGIASLKRIDFTNTLLYDFSKEQINIVHATVDGKRKSGKVSYPESKIAYQW